MVATGKGAELGVLIKGGEALQRAGDITTIVLDKTGTVTAGKPTVTDFVPAPSCGRTQDDVLRILASLESSSEHPLADSIVRYAKDRGLALSVATSFKTIAGRGAMGVIDGVAVMAGNKALLGEHAIDTTPLESSADELA